MTGSYTIVKMLESLDIPANREPGQDDLFDKLSEHDFVGRVGDFVTENKARQVWLEWNSGDGRIEDPFFLEAFHKMLKDGASMGFKLDRFKNISSSLPKPTQNFQNWIPFFERVVADCSLRAYVSKEDYERWFGDSNSTGAEGLAKYLDMMIDGLFYELGMVFPQIDFLIDDTLRVNQFRIEWNDLLLPPEDGNIGKDKVLVNDTVDRLALLKVKGEGAINPANGAECAFISVNDKELVESAGLTTWDAAGYFILILSSTIRRNAFAFVNIDLINLLLHQLVQVYPETISLIRKKIDPSLLVQIFRGLLEEEISIRNLPFILDKIVSVQSPFNVDFSRYITFTVMEGMIASRYTRVDELKVRDYVEFVRICSRRYISHKYAGGGNALVVYLMDRVFEDQLAKAKELPQPEKEELINAVRIEVGNLPPTAQNPVILTTLEVRNRLRKLLRSEFPNLAVLSYQELSPDMNIQPIARISYSDNTQVKA